MAPDPVRAPVTPAALDQATKMGWVVEAQEVGLEPAQVTPLALVPVVAVAAPVVATNPAQVLVTLMALVPAISPAEVVGTRSRFGSE